MKNANQERGMRLKSWLKRKTKIGRWLLLLTAYLGSAVATSGFSVQMESPPRFEAFVYALTVFDGSGYHSTFTPPQINSIYLLADQPNVLAPRSTMLYYWAITNRYEADWLVKNEFIEGVLEVYRGDDLILSVEPTEYVVQYSSNDPLEQRRLLTGALAQSAYGQFLIMQQQYRDALYKYYKQQQAYLQKVDELVAKGEIILESEFPKPPVEPSPMSIYSTNIARGYVVQLPEGSYNVQLRLPDGQVKHDSRKRLVLFRSLGEGISYRVMPGSRWSRPENSQIPHSVIYTPAGNTLYLQPFHQLLFDDFFYSHLIDPQDIAARQGEQRWVAYQPLEKGQLEVVLPSGKVQTLQIKPYKVIQIVSSGLGYEVREFDDSLTEGSPTFWGFRIAVDSAQTALTLRLLDSDASLVVGSQREVRALNTAPVFSLYFLSLLPLLAGIGVVVYRSKQTQKFRVEE